MYFTTFNKYAIIYTRYAYIGNTDINKSFSSTYDFPKMSIHKLMKKSTGKL